MIDRWDRDTVRLFQQEAETAVKAVASRHGVTLRPVAGRFNPDLYTMKFEVAVAGNPNRVDPEREAWKSHATAFGFKADDLDQYFEFMGKKYQIVGLKPSRPKYPVVAKAVATGKSYKFAAYDVQVGLAVQRGEKMPTRPLRPWNVRPGAEDFD